MALARGDWEGARTAFAEAVATGCVVRARPETGGSYAGFARVGDVASAVNAAVTLSLLYSASLGN